MIQNILISIFPLCFGWILDLLFGDPQHLPHPVVWMGKWIGMGEKLLNENHNYHRNSNSVSKGGGNVKVNVGNKIKGAVFAVCSIVLAYLLTKCLLWCVMMMTFTMLPFEYWGNMWVLQSFYLVVAGGIVFYCLAGHTLRKEVMMVFDAVDRSVEDGRKQVARIVGRDTSELSAQECRTAALETLAENLSDGVVAPLFWFAVLGVPGMVAYKMINTLDSMIGYQNDRYRDFGCWAAKIDDAANYVPARLTALLMIVAYKIVLWTGVMKKKYAGSRAGVSELLGFVSFFGPKHASPNSGWPEAALAGILDCRFGGPHNYFGEYFYKPYIGTNARILTTSDMELSVRISLVAECIMIAFILLLISCVAYWC